MFGIPFGALISCLAVALFWTAFITVIVVEYLDEIRQDQENQHGH